LQKGNADEIDEKVNDEQKVAGAAKVSIFTIVVATAKKKMEQLGSGKEKQYYLACWKA
jgi:hypothetical protein